MKKKLPIICVCIILGIVFFLLAPLLIGVWLPDIIFAPHLLIGHATTSSGDSFDVVQYWNRCDFYNTDLIHTAPSGNQYRHGLDWDDSKSWSVPISVNEAAGEVTVVLRGGRAKVVNYRTAHPDDPPDFYSPCGGKKRICFSFDSLTEMAKGHKGE